MISRQKGPGTLVDKPPAVVYNKDKEGAGPQNG
jgi:hypothetical protein